MHYLESLLATDEKVQLAVHQHWVTLVRTVVLAACSMAVLVLLAGLGTGLAGDYGTGLAIVATLAVLVPAALLARDIARWSSKVYVITTRRVIEVEGVLNKRVSDSNLDKVNDLVLRQSALGRMLGYGDIEIITGSDIGLNHLERIARPLAFQKTMLENKEDLDTLVRLGAGALPGTGDVTSAIERLASLRDRGLLTPEEFEGKKAELLARM